MPNITGDNIDVVSHWDVKSGIHPKGCFKSTGKNYNIAGAGGWETKRYKLDASKTLDTTGNEISNTAYKDPVNGVPVKVQPDNISIKVWERTK